MQTIIASQDVGIVLVDRAGGLADGLQAVVGDKDHYGADGDAVEGNAIESERELSDGNDHGDCGNHDVQRLVEVDLVLNPNTDTDHADHAVQQGGHATEHASRNRVDDGTELRAQAQQQCEASRAPVAAVEYTLVAAITPMFSPYVVVPEPPPKPAMVVPRPSANRAVPIWSS